MLKSAVHTHNIPNNESQEKASITVAIPNENNVNTTVRITQGEKNSEDSDFCRALADVALQVGFQQHREEYKLLFWSQRGSSQIEWNTIKFFCQFFCLSKPSSSRSSRYSRMRFPERWGWKRSWTRRWSSCTWTWKPRWGTSRLWICRAKGPERSSSDWSSSSKS